MTEEKFLEMINPLPDYDYFRFCPPDTTLGLQSYCRAYLNFVDPQSVFIVRERFSDYVFVDEEGNEASAIVEYSVFQGTPNVPTGGESTRAVKRVDKRQGTIDEDPEYRSFLASLAGTTTTTTTVSTPSETTPSTTTVKSTTTASSNAVATSAPSASPANLSVKLEGTEKKQTPWEAMLETIQQREEASEAQAVTPLIAYLNQRLERRKRHAAEDAKSGGGQKGGGGPLKSNVGFRSSASGKSNRVQVASRRVTEFGRRRTNSRSSPQVTSTVVSGTRDVSVKGEPQRKPSETSSIGGKRNTEVGGKPGEKMGSNRPARKARRRVSGPEVPIATSSAAESTAAGSVEEASRSGGQHQETEESEDRHQQRQRREKAKLRPKPGSKSDLAGDQQAADSVPAGGRQWGANQRAPNYYGDSRFSIDAGDTGGADEGGGYPEYSRGRGRFTTSRGRRGGSGRPQHPSDFSSRHEKAPLDGDDQEAPARDSQPPPRGGGPPGRGYRGGPRSFTASPRGRGGCGGGHHRP
ncbi:unnamed protein product [Schistocephalus solidus]|uniref:Regulator of nonsense transcripts 3A n=1 Tax=Schistocephalus solidus TaxID=70667 RepID=A0A183T240_SCHSO|nr:unnamed protein product [Schistocephalus solidus]